MRCHGDRSVLCRMEVLKRYCALPDYQRMCCKTCSNLNHTVPLHNTTSKPNRLSTVTSISSTIPPPTSSTLPTTPASTPMYYQTTISETTSSTFATTLSTSATAPCATTAARLFPQSTQDARSSTTPFFSVSTNSKVTSPTPLMIDTTVSPRLNTSKKVLKTKPKNIPPKKTQKKGAGPKVNPKKKPPPIKKSKWTTPASTPKKSTVPKPKITTAADKAKTSPNPPKNFTPAKTTETSTSSSQKKTLQGKTKKLKPPLKSKASPKKVTKMKKDPKSTLKKDATAKKSKRKTTTVSSYTTPSFPRSEYVTAALAFEPKATRDLTPDSTVVPPSILVVATESPQVLSFEDATMPSGTTPYTDVPVISSGDIAASGGAFISGDDVTVSYGNGGAASDTMVLDDGLTIPTINSEDMTDLSSTPWLDLSEYIPVSVPVPTAPPDTAATTLAATVKPQPQHEESNSVDVQDNLGVDVSISQNNLIPKSRISFREKTKNKRIQELLEEKRNFLLRMKRGHTT